MLIKSSTNRKCGPTQFLDTINISKNNEDFLIDFNLKKNVVSIGSTFENTSILEQHNILKQIEIKYSDIQNLSTDYGIISFSLDYQYENYILASITPKTLNERKHFADYHNEKKIIPIITYFTPYKGCSFDECNIVIECLNEVKTETDIVFDSNIPSIRNFIDNENCWGNLTNYPSIISTNTIDIGKISIFEVIVPPNTTLYLESNIGILNKSKITQTTNIELDLTSIKEVTEDVVIKISSKYWSGIVKKIIKISN
jgi:hypothetical protein